MSDDSTQISASDRSQIEHLLFEYAALIDAGDFAGVGRLFAEARLTTAEGATVATGAVEVQALYASTTRLHEDGTPRTRHLTTNVIIEGVDPDEAQVRSYFTVLQQTGTVPLQPVIAGRYRDRVVRRPGGWRFAERCMMPDLFGDLHDHLLFDPAALEG